jgi:hypothetical protein
MDLALPRKMLRTLEPYHGMIYFVPEANDAYERIGLRGRRMGYFASRSAAMGAVSADVVIATFFNFSPDVVRRAIPAAWQQAAPTDVVDARLGAADAALRRMLGDEITSDAMREAADLSRAATAGCFREGHPLYASHAAQPWPDDPHLVLWHAQTLLREFRGDGHVAVLVAQGLTGCEALAERGPTPTGRRPSTVYGSVAGSPTMARSRWTDARHEHGSRIAPTSSRSCVGNSSAKRSATGCASLCDRSAGRSSTKVSRSPGRGMRIRAVESFRCWPFTTLKRWKSADPQAAVVVQMTATPNANPCLREPVSRLAPRHRAPESISGSGHRESSDQARYPKMTARHPGEQRPRGA